MPEDAGSPFRDPDDEKFRPVEPPVAKPVPVANPVPVAPAVRGGRRRTHIRRYRFEMGEAIARTFVVWFRNFVPFSILSIALYVPATLFGVWYLESGHRDLEGTTYALLAQLVEMFTNQLLAAVVIWGVVERLRGRSPALVTCFSRGLSRIGPVLLVALGVTLPFAVVVGVAVLLVLQSSPSPGAIVGVTLLLLVPILFWYTIVFVSTPSVVVERPRFLGLGAIGRSIRLTSGRRWSVFGSIFTIYLVIGFSGALIGIIGLAVGLANESTLPGYLMQRGLAVLVQPLSATLPAVVYYQLRREKEGIDVEEIASVFD